MFKQLQTKMMLLLGLMLAGACSAWAAEQTDTYVFTSKAWAATLNGESADWTSNQDGVGYLNNGVQVTKNGSGANATSPVSFKKVSKIVVTYCTNAKAGVGAISVKVGEGTAQSFNVTAPSSGGTTPKTTEFTFNPNEEGKVTVTGTCTTNSVFIISVAITHDEASSDPTKGDADLSFATTEFNVDIQDDFVVPTLSNPNNLDVTYGSSDEEVAMVDEESGEVVLMGVGTAKITASFAGNDSYNEGSAYYTINVTDKRTDPDFSIDDLAVAVNDLKEIVVSSASDGNITYTVNDTNIAYEEESFIVGVAIGKTTVTATQAATSEYKSATTTFTVTVTKPVHVKAFNEVFYESFDTNDGTGGNDGQWGGTIATGNLSCDNADAWTFTAGTKASECAKFGTGSAGGSATAKLALAAGVYTLSFEAAAWNGKNESTSLSLAADGATLDKESVETEKGQFNSYVATLTVAEDGDVSITFSTSAGNCRFFLDEVMLVAEKFTPVVQSYGWATYIPAIAAQFADGDAYVVTEASVADGLTLETVTSVPANTPVLLKGEGAKTVTLLSSSPAAPENLLTICNGTVADKLYPYVLAKNGESACFKQWTGEASTLSGRAVLLLDEQVAQARSLFALDGEATAIGDAALRATNSDSTVVYDLQGRRVAHPVKGLYIVAGRKVVK